MRFDKNGKLVYEGNMKNEDRTYGGLRFDSNGGYSRLGKFEYDSWLGMDMTATYNLIQLSNVIVHFTSAEFIDDETWQIVYSEKGVLGLRRVGSEYNTELHEYLRAKSN